MSKPSKNNRLLKWFHDEYNNIFPLPSIVKRKLENGIRTAYCASLFFLVFNYWSWSGSLTFFSGAISIFTSTLYLGQWISWLGPSILATILGTSLGTLAGFTWEVGSGGSLQLLLMFLSLTAINRISIWERLPKVIGLISCLMAALLPNIFSHRASGNNNNNTTTEDVAVTGSTSMETILLFIVIPFGLTGFALIFPFPALACHKAVKSITKINNNIHLMVFNLTQSFIDLDNIDVYLTENEILFNETDTLMEKLLVLDRFTKSESFLIPTGNLPAVLDPYIIFTIKLLNEIKGLQLALKSLPINVTQLKFAQHLKLPLYHITNEIQYILKYIVNYHILLSDVDMMSITFWWNIISAKPTICYNKTTCTCNSSRCVNIAKNNKNKATATTTTDNDTIDTRHKNKNDNNQHTAKQPIPSSSSSLPPTHSPSLSQSTDCICQLLHSYKASITRLESAKQQLLKEYKLVRMKYVYDETYNNNNNNNINNNNENDNNNHDIDVFINTKGSNSKSRSNTPSAELQDIQKQQQSQQQLSNVFNRVRSQSNRSLLNTLNFNNYNNNNNNENTLSNDTTADSLNNNNNMNKANNSGSFNYNQRGNSFSNTRAHYATIFTTTADTDSYNANNHNTNNNGTDQLLIQQPRLSRIQLLIKTATAENNNNNNNSIPYNNTPITTTKNKIANLTAVDSKAGDANNTNDDSNCDATNNTKNTSSIITDPLLNTAVANNNGCDDDDDDCVIKQIIHYENEHLSIRNVSVRAAYLGRFLMLQSLCCTRIEAILTAHSTAAEAAATALAISSSSSLSSSSSFSTAYCFPSTTYYSMKHSVKESVKYIKNLVFFTLDYFTWFFTPSHYCNGTFLRSMVQPMKISAAITISSLFVVNDRLVVEFGVWAGITLCFIRQESSASSFLTCYNRLEGTVIGAFFSLAIYYLYDCPDGELCTNAYLMPLLTGWILVTCFFREGPRHGYTGVTAGITPIVLLLSPYVSNPDSAMYRVGLTLIAILIYLFIDLTIFPNRTDIVVRKTVLKCMNEISISFEHAVDAVHSIYRSRSLLNSKDDDSSKDEDSSNAKDDNGGGDIDTSAPQQKAKQISEGLSLQPSLLSQQSPPLIASTSPHATVRSRSQQLLTSDLSLSTRPSRSSSQQQQQQQQQQERGSLQSTPSQSPPPLLSDIHVVEEQEYILENLHNNNISNKILSNNALNNGMNIDIVDQKNEGHQDVVQTVRTLSNRSNNSNNSESNKQMNSGKNINTTSASNTNTNNVMTKSRSNSIRQQFDKVVEETEKDISNSQNTSSDVEDIHNNDNNILLGMISDELLTVDEDSTGPLKDRNDSHDNNKDKYDYDESNKINQKDDESCEDDENGNDDGNSQSRMRADTIHPFSIEAVMIADTDSINNNNNNNNNDDDTAKQNFQTSNIIDEEESKENVDTDVTAANTKQSIVPSPLPPHKLSSLEIKQHNVTACETSIKIATTAVNSLNKFTKLVDATLKLGIHEPDILRRPFPLEVYTSLNDCFRQLIPPILAVLGSASAMSQALHSMLDKNQEDVDAYLQIFSFMSQRLFLIAKKATTALQIATISLYKLFHERVTDNDIIDLSEIVSISRSCDRLLVSVEEYFRSQYSKQKDFNEHTDPFFIITWLNMFESVTSLVRCVSSVGRALLVVKEVELFHQ